LIARKQRRETSMAFLSNFMESSPIPELRGPRVVLRTPQMTDYSAWSSLRAASRKFLTPWEPLWPPDDLSRTAYRARMKRYARDIQDDVAYPFFLFVVETDSLCGGLTLSNIRRGVAQTATLGYWIGEPFAGKGLMTEAVNTLMPFVFDNLGLHRLEAACLPHNAASIRLLKACGFTQEGFARRYLRISGEWHDHLLFAILAEDRDQENRQKFSAR
jgi:ribosomal-protein-alanine N-acetyltransferase